MKKRIIRPIVMTLLFFGALITFSVMLNQDNRDLTTTMPEATLPIIYIYQDGTAINELHGYVNKMESVSMRDSIIPIGRDRRLALTIEAYGSKVDELRYEIRSIDAQRLVARNDVTDFTSDSGRIRSDVVIQNVLEENEEYTLVFTLGADGRELYYYTRLMQTATDDALECLDFAVQFHGYTFRDDADKFIPIYMDPATGDATTLDYVDLSCTLKQIKWASFPAKKLTEPVASFKEINDSYCVLTLQYLLTNTENNGEIEYYNVEEYFRLRLTSTRMYVLNFERRMNQLFRGENSIIADRDAIQLGIRNADIEYATNETGDIIAFVQEGELWCFNRLSGEIVQIYSFRGAEGIDPRENWNQHDIKIVRVDEAGSVQFVVYGYMNRGMHEGEVGTGVYRYDGIVHTVEEEVFIPYYGSYEVLKAETGQLMYANDTGFLYLMLNNNVYRIDLNTLATAVVVSDLKDNCYKTSDSNRYLAWVDRGHEYSSSSIYLMDLSAASVYEVTDVNDTYLLPLGFIDGDFIYGVAEADRVILDTAGNTVFPMSYLKIMGTSEESYEILKTYRPSKGYIESIEVTGDTIEVDLIREDSGRYTPYETDSIMDRAAGTEEKVKVGQTVTDVKETQRQLIMKAEVDSEKIKMITSKMALVDTPAILELDSGKQQERFYVYVKGDVVLATDSISDAIIRANECLGVVVDSSQQYVWMRARKPSRNAFTGMEVNDADRDASSVVKAVSAMLDYRGMGLSVKELAQSGVTPKSAIEMTLKESVVLDVSGCNVDEIIFYVSEGSPVFAMTGNDSAVLVIGYTGTQIYYFDPDLEVTKSMTFEQADEIFKSAGSIFFTYLDY